MRLGAQVLDFCGLNSYSYADQAEINAGSSATVYLQLVDLSKPLCQDGNGSCFLRYIPTAGSNLQIDLDSIDDDNKVTVYPTALSGDPSIYSFDILPSYQIGSANIHLTLTGPDGSVKTGVVIEGLKVNPSGPGSISFC